MRKPTDTIVLIIPSIEKMLEEFSSTNIIELDTSISLEKQISACKRLWPTSRIAVDNKLFRLTICSHKKKLEFMSIPTKISLSINWYGFWASTIAKLESKCLTA